MDNDLRDPSPSLLTLKGSDLKVMNLRPLEKDKHLGSEDFKWRATSHLERMH